MFQGHKLRRSAAETVLAIVGMSSDTQDSHKMLWSPIIERM